jgi:long-chain fatty acid transport protein
MRRIALYLTAAGMAVASPAHATNGMRMIGFGPVQNSMGGVGVGATLDGACVITNPAGLADLGTRLDLGVGFFKPTVNYQAAESPLPPGFQGAVVASPGTWIDSGRGGSPIPLVALVLPVAPRLAMGLGLSAVAGMGVDDPSNLYGGPTYSSYLQARLTPAISYRLNELLSFGLGVNAMVAQMRFDVARGFGQMPHDTATSLGIGAVAGVTVTPVKMLTVGLAYETKSFFQDFSFAIPQHDGVDPRTFTPVPGIPAGTDRLTFHQPQSATVGASVRPVEGLLVAADAQWIDWAQTNGTGRPAFAASPSGAMPWSLSWSSRWVFKLGAAVAVTPDLEIRAGYDYGKMPLDPSRAFENIAFPAVAEHHVTAGAGYAVNHRLTVNLAAMYSPKATVSGASAAYPAQGGQAIDSYESGMSQFQVDLGIGWKL